MPPLAVPGSIRPTVAELEGRRHHADPSGVAGYATRRESVNPAVGLFFIKGGACTDCPARGLFDSRVATAMVCVPVSPYRTP